MWEDVYLSVKLDSNGVSSLTPAGLSLYTFGHSRSSSWPMLTANSSLYLKCAQLQDLAGFHGHQSCLIFYIKLKSDVTTQSVPQFQSDWITNRPGASWPVTRQERSMMSSLVQWVWRRQTRMILCLRDTLQGKEWIWPEWIVHPKIKIFIHSPSCHSKTVWLSSVKHKSKYFIQVQKTVRKDVQNLYH